MCMFLYSGHLLLTLLQAALFLQSIRKLSKCCQILLASTSIFCSAAESLACSKNIDVHCGSSARAWLSSHPYMALKLIRCQGLSAVALSSYATEGVHQQGLAAAAVLAHVSSYILCFAFCV